MNANHYHALGKYMLAFTAFWAYIAFSQYLLIWSGNIREEIVWYTHRTFGAWRWVALGLIVLHFFVPFFVLLSRSIKRQAGKEGILFHQRRHLDDGEFVFLVNTSIDAHSGGQIASQLGSVEQWDPHTGKTRPYPFSSYAGNGVTCGFDLPPCGSLLLFFSTINTVLQTDSSDEMRGRVMGIWALIFGAMTPAGGLVAGALSHYFGVRWAIGAGAGICALSALIVWFAGRRRMAEKASE